MPGQTRFVAPGPSDRTVTAYHASFYRNVEVANVTPFSPRAMDRTLAAAVVAWGREGRAEMVAPQGASQILSLRAELEAVADRFADRAAEHYVDMTASERQICPSGPDSADVAKTWGLRYRLRHLCR